MIELRQYTMRPHGRDVLIELFDRELTARQEELEMSVIGLFVDSRDPDRFVWLRGFADMDARRQALTAFYEGPVWAANRAAANATMLDSSDVLLLRPARPGAGFVLDHEPPTGGADEGGVVAATIAYLSSAAAEAAAVDAFESAVAPAIAAAGGAVLGYFVTETAPNDYPRLPVREGDRVLVWFVAFADHAALDAAAVATNAAVDGALVRAGSIRAKELLELVPTASSLLNGRTGPCCAARRDRLDGARDFDFLAGAWRIRNRKLRNPAPGEPAEWVEFESAAESRAILGGLGNVDTYYAADFPDRGAFHGFALRLFEPSTGLWRIWWASSVGEGALDPPLAGRFADGEGVFEGDDDFVGLPIKVRFTWSVITETSARWEQAFSFDDGLTFATNWVMEFGRLPARPR